VNTSFDTKKRSLVIYGSAAVLGLLLIASLLLFLNLPDANAFNDRVEQIFVENDALTTTENVKLLEVLAQSGTAFADVLSSYRIILIILLVLASALLLSAFYFLLTNHGLQQQMGEMTRSGLVVNSLVVNREERIVTINDMEYELTNAICETLSVLCEARLDDDVLTGAELEAMISGKPSVEVDEASGATRIKRLRDQLGNQMISHLLVKNISRKGYMLAVDKDVIKMV
jgi:DNA-binding winged helix-turn-helix (wHTH) protein